MRLLRALRFLLAALGALVLLVTFTPLVPWWAARLAGTWTNQRGGTLIVLGGSSIGDEFVGHDGYLRAVYAARYFQDGKFQRLIVSGKGGDPMRRFVLAYGVPAEAVMMESAATSTRENALFTAKLLQPMPEPKVLVTSDFHMHRAHLAFLKAGAAVQPLPAPDALKRAGNWARRWPVFLELLVETGKNVYYWARGWI